MKIQIVPGHVPNKRPAPPQPPEKPAGNVLDHVGAVQLGGLISDIGMGAAYTLGQSPAVAGLGLAMAAFHGARGAAFALSARRESGMKLAHRIGTASAETLLAAGHTLGALGGGAWSVPLLIGGAVLGAVTDYRYRTHFGVDSPPDGSVSKVQAGSALANTALALGYATHFTPPMVGYAAGLGHLAAMAGYYGGSMAHPEMKHHWHSKGFGHALQAAGHIAGAAGAGVWALAPLVGGTLITTLQDYRQNGH